MIRSAVLLLGLALSGPAVAQSDLTGEDDTVLLEGASPTYLRAEEVELRALDKITGRYTDFRLQIGVPKVYGSLRVDLDVCFQTPPEEVPESAAFLRITAADAKQVQTMAAPRSLTLEETLAPADAETESHFSGWMFASSPGLNALEHPVYDVWVISCIAPVPLASSADQE
jgi:hypothetical protein